MQQLLIGVAGYGRTGKDTVASLIRELARDVVKIKTYKFADKVREECAVACAEIGIDPWTEDPVEKERIRPWMIDIGAGRRDEDPGFWIKALDKTMTQDKESDIKIVTDVRYQNEADWIMGQRGILILLHRRGFEALNAEEARQTSRLYSPTNPITYKPGFRSFWWTHEIDTPSYLTTDTKRMREAKSLLESIPELGQYTAVGKPVKLDREYLAYLKHRNMKVPASLAS